MISVKHLQLGRKALGWSAQDLAEASGLSLGTIKRVERGDTYLRALGTGNYLAIIQAFEAAGVRFQQEEDGQAGITWST